MFRSQCPGLNLEYDAADVFADAGAAYFKLGYFDPDFESDAHLASGPPQRLNVSIKAAVVAETWIIDSAADTIRMSLIAFKRNGGIYFAQTTGCARSAYATPL